MKNSTLFLLLILVTGCTRETYVEGLIPVSKSFSTNFIAPARNAVITQVKFNIEGVDYPVNFTFNRVKVVSTAPAYGASANDSLLICYLTSNLQLDIKNGHIMKYNKGDELPASPSGVSTNVPLFAALKKSPHTGTFNSLTQISTQPLYFGLNQDGYFSFRVNNSVVPVYGWVRLVLSDREILITEYGYRTFAPGKAGE
jgi:hypothetical protein